MTLSIKIAVQDTNGRFSSNHVTVLNLCGLEEESGMVVSHEASMMR